jgi:hypothetical protein
VCPVLSDPLSWQGWVAKQPMSGSVMLATIGRGTNSTRCGQVLDSR